MDLRDAALAVLYRLEHRLLQLRDANEPLAALRQCARHQGDKIDAAEEASSRKFLSEVKELPVQKLLQMLAERD